MKNLILFAALFFAFSTIAATQGTLHLKGTVGEELSIQVDAQAKASDLDLATNTENMLVAKITEKSNAENGYSVSISSQNLGALEHNNGDRFNYELKYNGNLVDLQNGDTVVDSGSGVQDKIKDVTISYTGQSANNMVAGEYIDNVTFSISAN